MQQHVARLAEGAAVQATAVAAASGSHAVTLRERDSAVSALGEEHGACARSGHAEAASFFTTTLKQVRGTHSRSLGMQRAGCLAAARLCIDCCLLSYLDAWWLQKRRCARRWAFSR